MIGFLKGNILKIKEQEIILNVRDVGYEIYLTLGDISLLNKNDDISLYIYYYQKEESLSLFGFLSEESKDIFKILINMNGIGPKLGMSILSSIDNDSLIIAIENEDINVLTNISGIGKKTAQRMIVELKEKFYLYKEANNIKTSTIKNNHDKTIVEDAEKALFFLGYKKREIVSVLNEILLRNNFIKNSKELIKIALKELSG